MDRDIACVLPLVQLTPTAYVAKKLPEPPMFTVTLLTNSAMYLDASLVANLRNAMGGGDATWLDPNHCAEFDAPKIPKNIDTVWESLSAEGVDLVVQKAGDRKRKILLADMDSTMIQQECIDELAAEAGVGKRVADITARAMNGELDFEAALLERVGLLKGLPETTIQTVIDTRITLMPGGKTLLATMKANGAHCALVSGGFTAFTGAIADKLGFDEHHANTLLAEGGALTGDVTRPILGSDAKVEALNRIASQTGVTPADVLAVGDGANDLGMLQLAGTGVALHAKPTVQEQAKIRVNHGDLTALLFIQGYAKADFVTP
jgi:phosphoserine phosphatase